VSNQTSFLFMAFPIPPQWVCHKKKSLKTAFLGWKEKSVSFLLRGSSKFDSLHGVTS
jgi:hypothetical protein